MRMLELEMVELGAALFAITIFTVVNYFLTLSRRNDKSSLASYAKNRKSRNKKNDDEQHQEKDVILPPIFPGGSIKTLRLLLERESCENIYQMAKQVGTIFRLKLPLNSTNFVVISELKTFREVSLLKDSIKPPELYDPYAFGLGNSIFVSEGPYWVHSRKAIAHAFSARHIRRMNEVVLEKSDKFINEQLDKLCSTESSTSRPSLDLVEEMLHLTLSIVTEAAFEYEISYEDRTKFMKEVEICLLEGNAGGTPFRDYIKRFLPSYQRSVVAEEWLMKFGMKILKTYKEIESPIEGTAMYCIMNNKHYKDDEERVADMLTLIIAGNETTAYSISWIMLELARNPMEQIKLQEELQGTQDRKNLKILPNVIKEGMRLNPVAGALGPNRRTVKDFLAKRDDANTPDILIPKGSIVFCSAYLLFRSEEYFKDALSFNPSRWENPSEEAKAALMPYWIGKHNCVGQTLANTTMHSVISQLCEKYNFTIAEEGSSIAFFSYKPEKVKLFVNRLSDPVKNETRASEEEEEDGEKIDVRDDSAIVESSNVNGSSTEDTTPTTTTSQTQEPEKQKADGQDDGNTSNVQSKVESPDSSAVPNVSSTTSQDEEGKSITAKSVHVEEKEDPAMEDTESSDSDDNLSITEPVTTDLVTPQINLTIEDHKSEAEDFASTANTAAVDAKTKEKESSSTDDCNKDESPENTKQVEVMESNDLEVETSSEAPTVLNKTLRFSVWDYKEMDHYSLTSSANKAVVITTETVHPTEKTMSETLSHNAGSESLQLSKTEKFSVWTKKESGTVTDTKPKEKESSQTNDYHKKEKPLESTIQSVEIND